MTELELKLYVALHDMCSSMSPLQTEVYNRAAKLLAQTAKDYQEHREAALKGGQVGTAGDKD